MSGIAGIVHFDGAPIEPGLIEKMTSAMAHRGPDGINHWVKGSVALGQCMLRTTPESLEEHQPLANEDESLVLVMDGRVDNWEELRRELLGRGAVLRTRADAELVLRAYEIWGRECLTHVDGDFAIVIWDSRRKEAFCARDRMGNKPFNYHWNGKTLAFASELHTILSLPWVPETINEGILAEFLAAEWYSRDETFWQGVLRLMPAHRMVVDVTCPRLEQYWAPDLWVTLPYTKDEEYIEHYRELLTDVVRRMSRSFRPLACEVSGGLDSSAIFSVAEHLRRQKDFLAPGLEGYTLAFTDDSDANELAYARAMGEHLGIPVHEIPPSLMPLLWYEKRARTYRTFPQFPNGVMSNGIYQRASERSRVLLSGVGGDEWLIGSRTYYAEELSQRRWRRVYDSYRLDTESFSFNQAGKWLLRWGFFPLLPIKLQASLCRLIRECRSSSIRDIYWLSPLMKERVDHRRAKFGQKKCPRFRLVGQQEMLQTLGDAYRQIANEITESYLSSFGMVMRHPFNEYRLVQHAFSTPERLRLRGDRNKYIHVRAMQKLMPSIILERKNKAEFSVVFRNHLDGMRDVLTKTIPCELALWVAPGAMDRLFQTYQGFPKIGWPMWVLWSIYGCQITLKPCVSYRN
jgi:asparagine synthase (glutamine-hydrolysing)